MNERTLDRVARFDEQSRRYPITQLIAAAPLRERAWRQTVRLDQGREGACVGFGWAHELNALPDRVVAGEQDARDIYRRAQVIDEWAGEAYEGTSVLAGAKAVQERGHLAEYRWAFGIDDVMAALAHHGPVVIGVPWYEGMFDTDSSGRLHPTGAVSGGHCVVLRKLARRRGGWKVGGTNSWGRGWGAGGEFWLWDEDLDGLLRQDGDACVPVRS